MIVICSAGRSGTAWLASVFAAQGLKVRHEWIPLGVVDPDVIADTALLWDIQFVGGLSANDIIILIDRDQESRMASIDKLLGKRDYSRLNELWADLKTALRASPAKLYEMTYERLFDVQTRDVVRNILFAAGHPSDNLNSFWDFFVNIRATNHKAEALCKASLGL